MTFSRLLLTTSLCAVVSFPAVAQQKSFSDVDADNDGSLSLGELEAAFGSSGAARLIRRGDKDGDNSLSLSEVRIGGSDDDESDDESDDEDDEDGDESDDDESNDSDESDDDENDSSDESDDDESSDESDDE